MAVDPAPPGVTNVYIPLADLKNYSGINSTVNDSPLWMTVHGASRAIDRICNRHFFTLYASRAFDIRDTSQIGVPDLASVTVIREDADGDRVYEITRSSDDYLLSPPNAAPTTRSGGPYRQVIADPMGARPSFSPGRSRIQIEGEWTYRRFVEDTGADLNNTGPLSAAATSVTVTDGSLVSSGQTLLIESEQIFIQDVIGNVLTIIRGVNGTSAVTHVDGLDVIVFRYPAEVVQATLLLAGRLWKRKDSPYGPTAGMSPGGKVSVPHSTDVDIATLLSPLRRLPLGVAV